jgi:hypothetical protein
MEMLSGLVNADDIHKPNRVDYISSDLATNLNEELHANLPHFISHQGVVKSVLSENDERQTFSQFAGGSGWIRSKPTSQFVHPPIVWSYYPFQMHWTTSHGHARNRKSSLILK